MNVRRPCAIAIACLCFTTAAAASLVQDDVKAVLVAARALIDSGKPRDAIAALRGLDGSVSLS
jgi:hypothetical protein